MNYKKELIPTKQLELSCWIKPNYVEEKEHSEKKNLVKKSNNNIVKPKLAFGYGYDPKILMQGINKTSFSHSLDNGLKLYEFQPKISYRIFKTLAKIMKYKCNGSELKKENTTIKNHYFTTDQDPEQIVKELDLGLKKVFEVYDPLSEYDN